MRCASAASILRDDHNTSSAAPAPISRGTIHVVPCSAIRPRLEKIDMNEPLVDAMRRSLITVKTKPPPAATPLTALMTGLGIESSHVNIPGTPSVFGRDDEPAGGVRCSWVGTSPGQKPPP